MVALCNQASFILIDQSICIHTYIKNNTTRNYQFWINCEVISMAARSKTFREIKDEISFSNAKVHFSGVGDLEIDDMDRGIQIERFEEIEGHVMFKEAKCVNVLTD